MYTALVQSVKKQAKTLGFADCAVTGINLGNDAEYLQKWLQAGHQGDMTWMAAHGEKRWKPELLHPGTIRVLSLRLDYAKELDSAAEVLDDPNKAYISRYALGRDYHKMMRLRLKKLADFMITELARLTSDSDEPSPNTTPDSASNSTPDATSNSTSNLTSGPAPDYRVFVDSAPVLEKALARNAGLGWIGKHTLVLNRDAGSWFFLGEIFTNCPLPIDPPMATEHCGSCAKCIDICPTKAIIAPYQLDAKRCISYLTIEQKGKIPVEYREAIGNRVFGCDDCQLVCPWNKYAQLSQEDDFNARQGLKNADLLTLFKWSEAEFLERTAGMAIRRTGYTGWLRNIAVALGNAPTSAKVVEALQQRMDALTPTLGSNDMLIEHIQWALKQHNAQLYFSL